MRLRRTAAWIVLLLVCLGQPPCLKAAGPETAAPDPRVEVVQDEKNRQYFSDLKVSTHDGRELRFYSDILKGKLAVISFFYVNCPTAQPALVTLFKLQKRLAERLDKDIVLLSISVEPEKDTPEAVREYAHKFNPRDGWLFLTGDADDITWINRRLGNSGRLPEGHIRLFLLGNLNTGHWMKMVATAQEIALVNGLNSLASKE